MSEPSGAGRGRKARGGLSRARRRRGTKSKVRTTPFPTRLHHHPEARTPSPGGGDVQPPRAAQYRQLRREGLKTKMVKSEKKIKSEKNSTPHSPCVHRCEQWSHHKQKSKCNIQHTKNSPKKSERLQTECDIINSPFRKQEKKPLASAENVRDLKPTQDTFPRDVNAKKINYAGAKFSDPPSPSDLPKPPSHWVGKKSLHFDQCKELMTFHLKTLLKVQL
ncbi:proline-rich nuclear receptor coactivator 1 isoform 1-T1 [Discoglossus pictus]